MSEQTSNSDPTTDASKPVEDWVTGDEPATGPQRSYLQTLGREAGEDIPDDLTKAQASEMIDRLQQKSGRGADSGDSTGGDSSGSGETAGSGNTSPLESDLGSIASPEAAMGEPSGAASESSNQSTSGRDSGGGSEHSTEA